MIKITIDGKPTPKKAVKQGRYNAYNSQKSFMDGLRWRIKEQYKGKLLTGGVSINVTYFMPIPKSTPKKELPELFWHIKRPDTDNLTKMIKDCMSGIVYKDDSQVCDSHYKKIYSDNPRTVINIEEL